MYYPKSIKKFALLAVCIAALSGCAVFKGGHVPQTDLVPTSQAEEDKPSISYDITFYGGLFKVTKSPDNVQNYISAELLQVIENSGYFRRISKIDPDSDVDLSVTIKNSGNPAVIIPAFITGFSFYTIPSWATDNFDITATAKNKFKSATYELHDSTTLVQWLPMIFAYPANNQSAIPEVRKNMYRNILKSMHDDGFITKDTR